MSSGSRLAKAQQQGKKSAKSARTGSGNITAQAPRTSAEADLPRSSTNLMDGMGHQGAANAQANQVFKSEIGAEIALALPRPEGGDGDEIPDRSKRASHTSGQSSSKTSSHSDGPYTNKLQRLVQLSIASSKNCVSPASDPLALSLELDINNPHAEKIMSQIESQIAILNGSGEWNNEEDCRAVVARAHETIAAQEKAKLERTSMLGHGSEGTVARVAGRAVQICGSVDQQNVASFRQGGPDYDEIPKHMALCPETASPEKAKYAKIEHGDNKFDPDAELGTIIMKKEEPLLPQNQHTQRSSSQNVRRATNTNDAEMSPRRGKKAEDSTRNDQKIVKPSEANAPKSMTKGGERKGGRSDKPKR